MSEQSRRNFLISIGGTLVGPFLMPGEATGTSESVLETAKATGVSLPPSMEVMELASLPTWGMRHVLPIDKELPVVHYTNKDGESWAWWPADDEELQAMESFYAATRTPGRPNVPVEEVFPIQRSPQELQLIQQIVANANDPQPKLAYAKWLDAQGSQQGELIRVQCQMAQLGSGQKFDELQDREQALLDQHAKEWFKPLAAVGLWPMRGTEFEPRLFLNGGVIDTLFIFETGVLPRYASELHQAAPAVSTLWLNTRDADIPAVVQIPWMDQIVFLRLRNEREFVFSDEDLLAMVDSPYLNSLNIFTTDSGHVTPYSKFLSGKGMGALCESDLFGRLEILDMDYLKGEASACLSKSTRPDSMLYVKLIQCDFEDDASFEHYRKGLEHLHLLHSRISFDCLRQLVDGQWSSLIHLCLTGTNIGDQGAQILADAEGLNELQYLSLADTGITAEGASALAQSPHLQQLNQVMLSYDAVGDEGVEVMRAAFGDRATFC